MLCAVYVSSVGFYLAKWNAVCFPLCINDLRNPGDLCTIICKWIPQRKAHSMGKVVAVGPVKSRCGTGTKSARILRRGRSMREKGQRVLQAQESCGTRTAHLTASEGTSGREHSGHDVAPGSPSNDGHVPNTSSNELPSPAAGTHGH